MKHTSGAWTGHSGRIFCAWSPTGETRNTHTDLWTGAADGTIRRWKDGRCTHVLEGHKDWIKSLHGRGRLLFSGSFDETIRCWDVDSLQCVQIYRGHFNCVYDVYTTAHSLYSCSGDETVKHWDLATGQCIQTFLGHDGYVTALQVESPTSIETVSGQSNAQELQTNKPPSTPQSGDVIYSGGYDQTIRIWDIHTSRAARVVNAPDKLLSLCIWSNYIIAGLDNNDITLWDKRKTETPFKTLAGHSSFVNHVSAHPFLPYLCSASADKTVRMWNLETFDSIVTLNGHTSFVDTAIFSNHSESITIYSGSDDCTIRKWDIELEKVSCEKDYPNASESHFVRPTNLSDAIISRATSIDDIHQENSQYEIVSLAADQGIQNGESSQSTRKVDRLPSFQTLLYAARKTVSIAKYVENAILTTIQGSGQHTNPGVFDERSAHPATPASKEVDAYISQGQNSVLQIELIRLQETLQEERDQRTEDRKSWNERIETLEERVASLESAISYMLSSKHSSVTIDPLMDRVLDPPHRSPSAE
eukprot:TRINITY_DN3956_c0_g2_i1.p1 TRINITY_DN3956_c0_g2~~TRINITY_DN3956_c0_g2_i1.p1  ORF type:complete len:532 (+),score=74.75 TRINITY_DN3956_c0_g2_i1:46-1641(+)